MLPIGSISKVLVARSALAMPLYLAMDTGVLDSPSSSPRNSFSEPIVPMAAESNQIAGELAQS